MTPRLGLPDLGVGIGLRREHFDVLAAEGPSVSGSLPTHGDDPRARTIDFLEALTENFAFFGGRTRERLADACARWPVVLHGVALSIGSIDPLDAAYLDRVARLVDATGARWWSDHLCFSSAHGVEYHDLVPLPFTAESVDHVAARVQAVRGAVGVPFLLENPSYYARWSDAEMDEASFFRAVVEAGDCGILLDVNNVYVNAVNHGFDARAYIDALPLERVAQIHLAGHTETADCIIDTHARPVRREVLDLYAYTIARTGPVATLLEWDHDIPTLDVMRDQLALIRQAGREATQGGHAPG